MTYNYHLYLRIRGPPLKRWNDFIERFAITAGSNFGLLFFQVTYSKFIDLLDITIINKLNNGI